MNWRQVGDAMMEAGRAFGEETSLGSLYMVVGEAQKEITKSWCAANPFVCQAPHNITFQGHFFCHACFGFFCTISLFRGRGPQVMVCCQSFLLSSMLLLLPHNITFQGQRSPSHGVLPVLSFSSILCFLNKGQCSTLKG
jgi:hypothetical protein